MMSPFSDVYSFENLYKAHRLARRGKQDRREVIEFELDLGRNLTQLSRALEQDFYRPLPYTYFTVTDPKRRSISALQYRDRVVQHSLCDNVVAPLLEPRLIYDNAACRVGKGTHFALRRLELFLREHYRAHGCEGWFLKCDVRKFFASIDHRVLLERLHRVPFDERTLALLRIFVESYEDGPGRGLPLGNQTSQWFALLYLDSVDRLVKERLHVRGYVRYMDDMVLVHASKRHLRCCLDAVRGALGLLGLELNGKTQIAPLAQGIPFLGWRTFLLAGGAIRRTLRQRSRQRMLQKLASAQRTGGAYCSQVQVSYAAHLAFGR